MTRWFRFYGDAINNPKVLRLSDAMFRAWVMLLCLASQNEGILPKTADIALILRMKAHKVAEWLTVLTSGGLLDCLEDGSFRPHNWNERQFQSDVSSPRVKRFRERQRNVSSTVTETPPDTEQKQITDTEQKKKTRAGALVDPWIDADRERFWAEFPNKVGKADAMKAFDRAAKKTTPDVLFPALHDYANKTDDRPFCNPATWLNQERWLDRPATATNGRRTVQQAADDLLAKIRAFEEPPPDSLCDGTGEDAVRLLPPN